MNSKEKNYEDNKVKDLVLFEDLSFKAGEIEEAPKISEEIDQENKIKLSTELVPHLGKFKYSSILKNESSAPINNIKIKVEYPNFLELTRSIPPTITNVEIEDDEEENIEQIKVEFLDIKGNDSKKVILFFIPKNNINEGKIRTFSAFVNIDGYIRVIESEPLKININPVVLQPKLIPSSEIAEFINSSDVRKAIRSYGIGNKKDLDLDFIFNRLEVILRANNLQYITKDKKKRILWYFGNDLETKSDLLVVGQVVENKIEWIISCNNQNVLMSVLVILSSELKDVLLRMKIIDSLDDLYQLECKACAYILPKFPKKGNTIKCQNCNIEQVVW
ncbi:MAG: hypothetical protein KGD57_05995 [Candidatus Lokiarchaeota archaeon]|nr:hypothetical protein [Candidatus Lokiarchaeota archaeon]